VVGLPGLPPPTAGAFFCLLPAGGAPEGRKKNVGAVALAKAALRFTGGPIWFLAGAR
tara:strand:- start:50 stop:220 length:171 start_codon:yes stop_codon:yes gene_type:complete